MEEDKIDQPETESGAAATEGDTAVKESETAMAVKDVLGKQLGKTFSSDEEALAAVDGLKNLVGDQKVAEDRKKAKELEVLKQDPNYAALRAELETVKLQQIHPEASEFLDEIRAIADAKGISYNEAFEKSKFGALVQARGKEEKEKQDKIEAIPGVDRKVTDATDDQWQSATKAANEGDIGPLMRLKMPGIFKENN
jgi:hypothetical protein